MNNQKMQELLIAVLDCGSADLEILKDCKHDFIEIVDDLKDQDMPVTVDTIMSEVFERSLNDLQDAINQTIAEYDETKLTDEEIELLNDLDDLDIMEDVETFHNMLDTHIYFVNNAETYKQHFPEALKEFENETGFEIGE